MTISLPDEMADRVRREADVRGMSADAVVQMVLNRALPRPWPPAADGSDTSTDGSATLALLEELRLESEAMRTDDPAELARRDREHREFLRAIDRHAHEKPETD